MSDNMAEMTDAELDAAIYNNPSEHEEAGETSESISPANESEEQPEEAIEDTDDDQSDVVEEDSEDELTDEDQTDDSEQETSTEADEADEDDTDDSEDKGTETDDDKSEQTTKFQNLKANGKEYPIDSIDELYKLASAGVGAQQKYQAIAGHKKSIMAAEKAGVDIMEAVNLMANYKENPKEAIMKLLKDNNIDPMDIDLDAEMAQTKDHSVSDFEVSYDEVVGEIGDSPIFPKVQELLLKGWDQKSRDVFLEKPEMIKQLHEEMSPIPGEKHSMYDIVSPIADKMKLSGDMRSDFDIYMDARAKKVAEFEKHSEAVKKAEADKPAAKSKAKVKSKKKAAAPTGGNSTGSKTLDFAAMSDAELDAFLEKA